MPNPYQSTKYCPLLHMKENRSPNLIIFEGIDGVGKSTCAEILKMHGYQIAKYNYNDYDRDLFGKYTSILQEQVASNVFQLVMDRSFISEMVYGEVIRNSLRLSSTQFLELVREYSNHNCKIVYLFASKNTLLKRRESDPIDYNQIHNYYEELLRKYEACINIVKQYIPLEIFNTDIKSSKEIVNQTIAIEKNNIGVE